MQLVKQKIGDKLLHRKILSNVNWRTHTALYDNITIPLHRIRMVSKEPISTALWRKQWN